MSFDPSTLTDFALSLPDGTNLVNPFSARRLKGKLAPIKLASGDDKLARTVNGKLIDLSAPQMRKYRLEITGGDQAPPAFDGLWTGMVVIATSLVEIGLAAGGAAQRPQAALVGEPGGTRQEGNFYYYRPVFTMRVVDFDLGRQEYDQTVPWSLVLEEI